MEAASASVQTAGIPPPPLKERLTGDTYVKLGIHLSEGSDPRYYPIYLVKGRATTQLRDEV